MSTRCPGRSSLEGWARQGAGAEPSTELEAHTADCESCRDFFREVMETRELAARLPEQALSAGGRDAIRFELMAAARRNVGDVARWPRKGRWARLSMAAAAAVVLAVTGAVILRLTAPNEPEPGVPVAHIALEDGAAGVDLTSGPDRVYRLRRGAAEFQVDSLQQGERFRVLAGDGMVEVRGTRFRVEVMDGRLSRVTVHEGSVHVGVGERLVAALGAGERWARPDEEAAIAATASRPLPRPEPLDEVSPSEVAVAPSSEQSASVTSPRLAVPRSKVSRRRVSPPSVEYALAHPAAEEVVSPEAEPSLPVTEVSPAVVPPGPRPSNGLDEAFSRAWQTLSSGRPGEAASMLDTLAARPDMDRPRLADVLYWSAEAHRRSGNLGAAEARARRVLDEAPNTWQAPAALLLLGEAALRQGHVTEARSWLERASLSGRPSHRARARALLDQIEGSHRPQ